MKNLVFYINVNSHLKNLFKVMRSGRVIRESDSVNKCQKSWVQLRCCYITVNSATSVLQNIECTFRCISKQIHYTVKHPFTQGLEFYEELHHFVLSGENKLFDNIILAQNHAWHIIQSG